MKNLKILIVDDNKMIRDGINLTLSIVKSWKLETDEASGAEEAIRKSEDILYDIILMDISMPGINGIEASQMILDRNPNQKIIVVSIHSSKDEIKQLKFIGVRGYLLKEDIPNYLKSIIERVLNEEIVFDLNYY